MIAKISTSKPSNPKIEEAPYIAMASAPSSTGQSTTRERPLAVIVDDEIHYCELLGDWMAELGYRLATFANAWLALDFIRTTPPVVLVTDVVSPADWTDSGWLALPRPFATI